MISAWLLLAAMTAGAAVATINWQPWSEAAFVEAKAENKLVVLDLEAVWCHWCHVMNKVTYRNPEVINLMTKHVVAVKVDQDSRPDLASRYEEYGWPATIIFSSDGRELAKLAGYLPPATMSSILKSFISNQTPGPSVTAEKPFTYAATPKLPRALQTDLKKKHKEFYDQEKGGWGWRNKSLDWFSTEYAMKMARRGDKAEEKMARTTLRLERRLLDPVWGGAYQYSSGGDWNEPHFEKIMQTQAEVMRIYALAYSQWRRPEDLAAAREIKRFVDGFLTSPEGGFYTSMDADLKPGEHSAGYFRLDDKARRRLGLPRVDKNRYARENGWMIHALAELYAASGDETALMAARRAAAWTTANRRLAGGGFRHGEKDPAGGPFLGDSLAMARAYLSLYLVTGERPYLAASEAAANFIAATFANPSGPGYLPAKGLSGDLQRQVPNQDDMTHLARFAALLAHVTGEPAHRAMSETAMRHLATPEIAKRPPTAGVLLAADELGRDPTHITIVGAKDDERARKLFVTALRYPDSYKRVEWWDRSEGALRHMDVTYPELDEPAAFACIEKRCSLPLTKPEELIDKLLQLTAPATEANRCAIESDGCASIPISRR